jgi:hypothetical protein
VIITPEPGRHAEIGQRLLALADHPSQVQWVTWPQAGYAVPVGLLLKFEEAGADSKNLYVDVSVNEEVFEGAESAVLVEETPKKRGRPRKTQPVTNGTDEPEKEE